MDNLSRYLRELDAEDQESVSERDWYFKCLVIQGMNEQRKTTTIKNR